MFVWQNLLLTVTDALEPDFAKTGLIKTPKSDQELDVVTQLLDAFDFREFLDRFERTRERRLALQLPRVPASRCRWR